MEVIDVTTSWSETAEGLLDRLGYGMDALWAVLYAAQHAALVLALDDPPGDDTLTRVGIDLADALGEVEWARPELARYGIALDLRPETGLDPGVRREQLAGVIAVAGKIARALAVDAGDETLDLDDLTALTRVLSATSAASASLVGVRA
jgi:hypothetical protein